MYKLYGFFTQNSMKALYVLEELGCDYEFAFVDLGKGEQRSEPFAGLTPIGKVPLLQHDDDTLFESGAICRYVANVEESPLYPANKLHRAKVDQWMDFFTCHLGRWLTKLYFEAVIKPKFSLGDPDLNGIQEARGYADQQFRMLDGLLANSDWIANDRLSIADLFAFAYVEQYRVIDLPIASYKNVQAWFDRIESRKSIANARARLPQ
ncbi:MAG TPA: glutathione S-transferase family protein [Woeseiaceae bacterium]|nr:glutathione S-transferase family protein [Woeseiaceae bacterium]